VSINALTASTRRVLAAQAKADASLRESAERVADTLGGFNHRHVPKLRELERKEQVRRDQTPNATYPCYVRVDGRALSPRWVL
jgi:hypothetical protein